MIQTGRLNYLKRFVLACVCVQADKMYLKNILAVKLSSRKFNEKH